MDCRILLELRKVRERKRPPIRHLHKTPKLKKKTNVADRRKSRASSSSGQRVEPKRFIHNVQLGTAGAVGRRTLDVLTGIRAICRRESNLYSGNFWTRSHLWRPTFLITRLNVCISHCCGSCQIATTTTLMMMLFAPNYFEPDPPL